MEDMLAAACAEAGLDDFGSDDFREALQRLIDSSNRDPYPLSELGSAAFKGEVQRMLVNRLRFARDLKLHPEILDEQVDDPIVIIGMARTGTTKLQRFIAADPDVQRLEYWRLFNPAPFPDAIPGQDDPRKEAARQAVAMMAQMMPNWMDSHPTAAEEVDEDVFLQIYTFKCKLLYLMRPVPSYQAWMQTQPLRDTYQYTKRLLQYLQWQDGGRAGKNGNRPWIMKSPVHLGSMDVLLDTFPRATLVCPHRDLHEVIPSLCRLVENTYQLYLGKVDRQAIGQACLESFSADIKQHLWLRDRMGARLDIIDVRYDDIRHDVIGVVRKIYAHAGRDLTLERENAMLAWDRSHSYQPKNNASYRMEDYGLTDALIDTRFKEYNSRFIR